MFDTRTVHRGRTVWKIPSAPKTLSFSYTQDGQTYPAEAFAERTFTDALLIIKDGRIVHEQYLNRTTPRTHFMSYSMGKTFNSIMAGMAARDGRLSVNDQIVKYVPEMKGGAYDGLTLKNLLQMRTGVAWDDNFFKDGPARDAHVAAFVDNKGHYFLSARQMKRGGPAGQQFNYNSIEAALMGEVVSRAAGRKLADYLSETLWKPAGMEADAFYVLDGPEPDGREFTAGAFNAVLRDYGRVGLMMLNDGRANGRQVLPASWVRESTTPGPGSAGQGRGYAYFWWTLPGHAYSMIGGEGQFVFVDPATRTVIVKLSHIPVGERGARAMAETYTFLTAASQWKP